MIGTADRVIPPAEMLFMAHRAHARITEIKAGHLSLITNPGAVARVIIDAARATGWDASQLSRWTPVSPLLSGPVAAV